MISRMTKIYLASPYGFSESTRRFLEELKVRLKNAGHEVNDPWELGEDLIATFRAQVGRLSNKQRIAKLRNVNRQIGQRNRDAIEKSEAIVAALDGSDVDSGTASEIGYAFARGKIVFGYRGDFRLTGENEAAAVNIQVQYWIEESGGSIVRSISDLLMALKKGERMLARIKKKNRNTSEYVIR